MSFSASGPDGRYALFTFLTYRHGHFGPRLFGPIRRLLPSPIQSNWRIHVTDPQTGRRGIYFLSTAITSTPHALGGRLLSEGVPMHVPGPRRVDPRCGRHAASSARPRPRLGARRAARRSARSRRSRSAHPWTDCFGDWMGFLAYCVPQDRAMSSQPWYRRVTRQEIELGIPLESCRPLVGEVQSAAAARSRGTRSRFVSTWRG